MARCEAILEEARQESSMLSTALDGARTLNAQLQNNADSASREISHQVNDSINKERLCEELRAEIAQLRHEIHEAQNQVFSYTSAFLHVFFRKLSFKFYKNFEKNI